MTFNEEFIADLRQSAAPAGVITNALRWDILNDWVRYLNDDQFPDKTAEMSYHWGFIKSDFGGDALRCLWNKHQSSYAMFAEIVWVLHREFSEGAGADHHPLFAGLPPDPCERSVPEDRQRLRSGLAGDERGAAVREAQQGAAGLCRHGVTPRSERRRTSTQELGAAARGLTPHDRAPKQAGERAPGTRRKCPRGITRGPAAVRFLQHLGDLPGHRSGKRDHLVTGA
ncbi:hypothetical protein [Streptomyces purpurogeneiscleroticus]|uniref:hypothetical protein n=1 Tax=Streptomyces purpurogeneiscleroticus TaxID=68259 RepID=UPI001CBCDDBC|nr:hypothetical protein [Streptomyces purpurogeneiscleroticus]